MRPAQTRLIFVIRGVSSACVQSALGLAGSWRPPTTNILSGKQLTLRTLGNFQYPTIGSPIGVRTDGCKACMHLVSISYIYCLAVTTKL